MTTKKTASKKPAAKKKAPAEFNATRRVDYAKGARVKVLRKNGDTVPGRVHSVVEHATGYQIYVNIGTDDRPNIKGYRPVQVKGF